MSTHREVFYEITETMHKIQQRIMRQLDKPEHLDIGLTKNQESILMYIFTKKHVTLTGIADYFNISKSAVSQSMNKLEELEIITRRINDENRREMTLELGSEGQKMQKEFRTFEKEIIERYLSQIDIAELQQVRDVFQKIETIVIEDDPSSNN